MLTTAARVLDLEPYSKGLSRVEGHYPSRRLYCFALIAASISGITLRSFGRFAARFICRIAGNPATRKVLAPSVVSRELATSSLKANPPEPESELFMTSRRP